MLQPQAPSRIMEYFLTSGNSGVRCRNNAQPLQSSDKLPVPEQMDSKYALSVANSLHKTCQNVGINV
jgi:hypothetical protein